MYDLNEIIKKTSETVVKAGSTFREDKINAYKRAIASESNLQAKWVMENILENAVVAEQRKSPLCDDTGIPHVFLEIGEKRIITGEMFEAIYEGIRDGLRKLPGRPMAVMGNDEERISQSEGLSSDPGDLEAAPLLVKYVKEDILRLHIIMQGGGPAIRGKTFRVFHKHKVSNVLDEIVEWSIESTEKLGCTPCTLAIGIGRSHFEAASMMLEAQVYGNYAIQNDMEKEITNRVNQRKIGALGLKGDTTVLATFMKVGPQRASGVRIVSMRPCCCFEPRIASVDL
ncbi:fumarate hydratase [Sellimonas catena]|uniref:Fumarate hydratase n=1 Tax=Sellimonas catena TaxID=2994035 RepID=A0A9W6CKU6_9FIRM|nr:fumarate hydratase [Sellimonas catena]GLG91663.1 fumarate hydratase [Sellimonas catena]